MNICVIPARGGSKRIPRKNIKLFHGKPIIAWSIQAAIESECFDRIIVSTDDDEIATISEQYGAEIPFMRPAELADDFAGTTPVMSHAVRWVQNNVGPVEYACCIYATAPFLSAADLIAGHRVIKNPGHDFAFSVTSFPFPIQRALRISNNGEIGMFDPSAFETRSQDLEEAWHDAGQFYWGTAKAWCEQRPVFGQRSAPICLPRARVQDIDTPEDWERADFLFRAIKQLKAV